MKTFSPKPLSDEDAVSLYADLVKFTKQEIETANSRLAEYSYKLSEAASRVANKR